MKKMFLVLAIMAIASGAFAAWTGTGNEAFNWFAASGTDTIGTLEGTDDATIYARFRVLGPKFQIVIPTFGDTWEVTDFLPGEYGWQTNPFVATNIGGMALDLGTLADDADGSEDAITNVTGSWSSTWSGAPNTYRMWAAIVGNGAAAPSMAATAGNASTLNNLNFTDVASGWYDVAADGASYMVPPAASEYMHVADGKLNLWATDNALTTTADNVVDLYLGMLVPYAGWSYTGTKSIPITVYGRITTF